MLDNRRVSSFGLKVLQKLAGRKKGKLMADGTLVVGHLKAPASLVNSLAGAELVAIEDSGIVIVTEVGHMFLRRHQSSHGKNRKDTTVKEVQENFAAQHQKVIKEEIPNGRKKEHIIKNIGGSSLAWLMQRKDKGGRPFINRDHFEAGEQLCRDHEFAGLISKTTSHYDGIPIGSKHYYSGAGDDPTVAQLAAKRRVQAALDFVGPGLSDVLVRVCCYQEGLEQAERNLAWPNRSAKLVLRFALDRLVEHYDPKN